MADDPNALSICDHKRGQRGRQLGHNECQRDCFAEAHIERTGHGTERMTNCSARMCQREHYYSLDGCSLGSECIQGCGDRRGHCRSHPLRATTRPERTGGPSGDRWTVTTRTIAILILVVHLLSAYRTAPRCRWGTGSAHSIRARSRR